MIANDPTNAELAVCPYLGLADDPRTRFSFPVAGHRCQVKSKAAKIDLTQQARYCLSGRYSTCDRYRPPKASAFAPGDQRLSVQAAAAPELEPPIDPAVEPAPEHPASEPAAEPERLASEPATEPAEEPADLVAVFPWSPAAPAPAAPAPAAPALAEPAPSPPSRSDDPATDPVHAESLVTVPSSDTRPAEPPLAWRTAKTSAVLAAILPPVQAPHEAEPAVPPLDQPPTAAPVVSVAEAWPAVTRDPSLPLSTPAPSRKGNARRRALLFLLIVLVVAALAALATAFATGSLERWLPAGFTLGMVVIPSQGALRACLR